MFKIIIWGILFYIAYKLYRFFSKVNSAINKANQANEQPHVQQKPRRVNPDNIIEAEFEEIESKIKQDNPDK